MCKRSHSLAVRDPGSCSSAYSGQVGPAALTTAPAAIFKPLWTAVKWNNPVSQCNLVVSWTEGCQGGRRRDSCFSPASCTAVVWGTGNTPQAVKGRSFFQLDTAVVQEVWIPVRILTLLSSGLCGSAFSRLMTDPHWWFLLLWYLTPGWEGLRCESCCFLKSKSVHLEDFFFFLLQ